MVERIILEPTTKVAREMIMARSEGKFSSRVEFLPCGSSMLSLISSGRINDGGFPRGRIINIVGDGSSGKTLVALEFAAAVFYAWTNGTIPPSSIFTTPKRLFIIYNNVEGVMDFDVERMYGAEFYNKVEWISSPTVEEFGQDFFGKRLANYKPGDMIIYFVDSWDALDSKEDKDKFEENIDKIAQGKKPGETGSYELGKQKYASKRFFKKVTADIQSVNADFTFVILSQVRKKIGVTFGEKSYRAGGDALNFYTHLVIWLAEVEKMKMQRLGQKRVYGIKSRARVKRSKVWKPFREADFEIVFDYGIDDVASLMDFYFGPKKKEFEWLGEKIKREAATNLFHDDSSQLEMLKTAVQEIWDEVEKLTSPTRRKY
jgi:recombination protein RecA